MKAPRRALLYDAVGVAMFVYSRLVFDLRVFWEGEFRLDEGTLLVCSHRSDHDVPIICGSLYVPGNVWRHRRTRPWFAVRDDLFLRGFFAGYPPRLSPRARRLLYPLGVARPLLRNQCLPIRSPQKLRLAELLRAEPGLELSHALPETKLAELRRRAEELALPEPRLARNVLRGEFADLLWTVHDRKSISAPELEQVWHERRRTATQDFHALADVLARGETLLLFPEGRPSPDGAIGPLQPGVTALVRRGSPRWLQPVALAYDPLTAGRTRAYLRFAPRVEPPSEHVEERVLELLRRTTPLTPGQLVAAGRDADPEVEEEVEAARAAGRPFEPRLVDPEGRRRLLDEARAAAERAAPETLARLAREHASARESVERVEQAAEAV